MDQKMAAVNGSEKYYASVSSAVFICAKKYCLFLAVFPILASCLFKPFQVKDVNILQNYDLKVSLKVFGI
jgi:hypothetical protein